MQCSTLLAAALIWRDIASQKIVHNVRGETAALVVPLRKKIKDNAYIEKDEQKGKKE